MLTIRITPRLATDPPGKLADAELHFNVDVDALLADLCVDMQYTPTPAALRALHQTLKDYRLDLLSGLKLIGFTIWEQTATRVPADRGTSNARNVTFPARQYSINGERRSFALLRPVHSIEANYRLRDLILEAYAEYEENESARTAEANARTSFT